MRINPISNITRKALPIAAAAALSLGTLTACSSSKSEKQELTYTQTEMLKLDKTLDSLKSVRGEGGKAFVDYYDKSKATIESANLDSVKAGKSAISNFLVFGGGALGLLGVGSALILFVNSAFRGKPLKNANTFVAAIASVIGVGLVYVFSGLIGQITLAQDNNQKFEQYKIQKLNDLETEQSEFINTLLK